MISVRGLKKYYGETKAVNGVDFDIKKGEIVGLLGPNGAGKTTTLRILTGYLTPTEGDVNIDNMNVIDNLSGIKKIIGYLPESAPLYGDMAVYDYLEFIASIQEVKSSEISPRIHYVSDKCGLNSVMDKKISELSKGYKQRVGLAHAIIHDPAILILDEPTSGLDPNQIIEIRELIKELGREKTVILSTHILSEVEATCSRVIIINKGNIVKDESTDNLISDAGTSDVVSLQIKTHAAKKAIESLLAFEGINKIEIADGVKGVKNVLVYSDSGRDLREAIYNKIKGSDWTLLEMKRERQSLENIFQDLTKEA
jgi:ABC-2 type transport system ATP-binding protein